MKGEPGDPMSSKNKFANKSTRRRTRTDPLGEATRSALIEKAEAMFAEKGVEGVSIRQIGVAIGSSNSNVVGYHFGTKEALVEAILLRNRPQIEARRAELLDQAKRDGRGAELFTLLDALCRPIFERTNADGRHTYALFLWHISRSNWWAGSTTYEQSRDILKHIAKTLPQIPKRCLLERMQAVGDLVSGVLRRLDDSREDEQTNELMFAHALQMANAIVTMPVPDGFQDDGWKRPAKSARTIPQSVKERKAQPVASSRLRRK
jgi:AcrR family transcriptional regulator